MRITFVGVFGLALLLTSTFSHAEQQTGGPAYFETTSKLGYHYQLTAAAEHMEVMKPLPVVLAVSDPAGKPVTEATITCALTMPAMAMPLNTPTLKREKGSDGYQGVFLLTMGGLWHMEVTSIFPDGSKDNAVLAFSATAPNAGDDAFNQKLEDLFHQQNKATSQQP